MVHVAEPHRSPVFATVAPLATNVPPKTVNDWPPNWVTPAPATFGSSGIALVFPEPPHPAPAHGSAAATVRLYVVR